jgi:proteasome-associated ATPase
LKSIVDRAKEIAIRRTLDDLTGDHGLRVQDFLEAVDAEFQENEIFPKSDQMEDWLKLLDVEPESVAKVRPIDDARPQGFAQKAII